jgi:hypothetical protein
MLECLQEIHLKSLLIVHKSLSPTSYNLKNLNKFIKSNKSHLFFGAIVFLISFILRTYDIASPYGRTMTAAGSTNFWHIAGENYLKYGYFSHFFTPILNTGTNFPPELYTSHPSFTAFYLSIFYLLFGSSVLITKIAALIGWYAVSFLIFKIAAQKSIRFAYYALLASFVLPFTNGFSLCIDSIGGPLVVVFSLLYFYCLETKKNNSWVAFSLILAAFTEWSFVPLIVYSSISPRYRKYTQLIWILGLSTYAFMIWLFINQTETHTFATALTRMKQHVDNTISIDKFFSRILITYTLTLFTPFVFIGGYQLIQKYKFTFIPLLFQPLIMVLAFPFGAYKHAFWICTLCPFACLAIAEFSTSQLVASISQALIKKYSKLIPQIIIIAILIFSGWNTIYHKERGKTDFYFKAGNFIRTHSNTKEIIVIPAPGMASDANSERLLLGYYAKRDFIMLSPIPDNEEKYFWKCSSIKCKRVLLN